MASKYQICSRCIMDTTDPEITFDEYGVCNHCNQYDAAKKTELIYNHEDGGQKFKHLIKKIKKDGKKSDYDCIIGVSGGVDSSYAVYKVKKLGLRPLAVHLDNGWNSELAVQNIELLLNKLDIELYTYVIDWEEFKALQVAFLKASTPDSEIPTDHAILAVLYQIAVKEKIRYIITGHNFATEGYGVRTWSQGHGDWRYIKLIHRKFGTMKSLKTFPHYGIFRFVYYKLLKRLVTVRLMNYIPYEKSAAVDFLQNEFGWRPYKGKHGESIYTSFYQGYILPNKFGYDKRKIHLSALISAGEISRDEALKEIKEPAYPEDKIGVDTEYVAKKLGLTCEEFNSIMASPIKSFSDYPSYKNHWLFQNKFLISIYHRLLAR